MCNLHSEEKGRLTAAPDASLPRYKTAVRIRAVHSRLLLVFDALGRKQDARLA